MATPTNDPWVHKLNVDELQAEYKAKSSNPRRRNASVFRVPPYMRKLKPYCYEADVLPMGLYYRDFNKKSGSDQLKLEVLSAFLEHLKIDQDAWPTFCKELTRQPPNSDAPEVDYFYEGGQSLMTSESIQSVLVIDAFFIAGLFLWRVEPETESEGKWVADERPPFIRRIMEIFYRGSVNCNILAFDRDIFWLCESQIPLFLVKNVWERVAAETQIDTFGDTLRENLKQILTNSGLIFQDPTEELSIPYETCDHLLACLHRAVSKNPDVSEEKGEEDEETNETKEEDGEEKKEPWHFKSYIRMLPVVRQLMKFAATTASTVGRVLVPNRTQYGVRATLPSATQLAKTGIRFRGAVTDFEDVRFVKSFSHLTATLYLPVISVKDFTEKILLNMCMYESLNGKDEGVHEYLLLMDELIDAEEDVDLLMDGHEPVIDMNSLGDDKRVADFFANPLQNFWFIQGETDKHMSTLRADIMAWYSDRWRRQVIEFVDSFRVAPWLLVSLLAATVLLVLTVVQTIYTIWGFNKQ
ncbi:hypothetical protein R1flu_022155 [Riccia fluitans]|uniref:Uncharacterized protein n=1 Tax=Riccia fluitans TaxID=41844 RepID=A0ABD1ZS19_9MARC